MYRSDVLYKLIPRIVNPKSEYVDCHSELLILKKKIFAAHKRKFYSDTANKPEWYPVNVPFKAQIIPKVLIFTILSMKVQIETYFQWETVRCLQRR